MKLSVIIPVYNVEYSLSRCIESVLGQDVDDMEVILVDDGSPDGSPRLCDEWQSKDSRIRVIHKQNGGLSDARNKGMEIATGELLAFVDSDDEITAGTMAPLVAYMTECADTDLVEYPVFVHYGHPTGHLLSLQEGVWTSPMAYWEDTEAWEHCYAWNKMFRRTAIADLRFPVGRVFEDFWFYPELLTRCRRIATVSTGRYLYHWNESGITAQAGGNELLQLLEAQQRAARLMHTRFFSTHGWKLYRSMLYRQLDVYRLTGRILLSCPLCRPICMLHKWIKQ